MFVHRTISILTVLVSATASAGSERPVTTTEEMRQRVLEIRLARNSSVVFQAEFIGLDLDRKQKILGDLQTGIAESERTLTALLIKANSRAVVPEQDRRIIVPMDLLRLSAMTMGLSIAIGAGAPFVAKLIDPSLGPGREALNRFAVGALRGLSVAGLLAGGLTVAMSAWANNERNETLMTPQEASELVDDLRATQTKVSVLRAKYAALSARR